MSSNFVDAPISRISYGWGLMVLLMNYYYHSVTGNCGIFITTVVAAATSVVAFVPPG